MPLRLQDHQARTKLQLQEYLTVTLEPRLRAHPYAMQFVNRELAEFRRALEQLPSDPPGPLQKPELDSFVTPAFRSRHQALSRRYQQALGDLAGRDEGEDDWGSAYEEVLKAHTSFSQSAQNYTMLARRYEEALEAFQRELADEAAYRERLRPYERQISTLRRWLSMLIRKYNENAIYDAPLGEEDRWRISAHIDRFRPTGHWWNPDLRGGAYIYDFGANRIQVQIEKLRRDRSFSGVRVKLYGELTGAVVENVRGMVEHLIARHPPHWQELPAVAAAEK